MAKQIFMLLICLVQASLVLGGAIFSDLMVHDVLKLANVTNDIAPEREASTLNCSKYRRDYDIVKSFPFSVQTSPQVTANKTYVLMDTNNAVTDLTIYKEKYVPMNVYCLKNLKSLTIVNTRFYEFPNDDLGVRAIPAEIGELKLLTQLHIYDSPVQYLPKEIANLNALTQLTVENGALNELPSVIGQLTRLQIVRLPKNNLKSLPATISSLASLNTLDIQSNQLTTIDELQNAYNLRTLYAQNCQITFLPTNLPHVDHLNMSHNNLEDLFGIGTLGYGVGYGGTLKFFDFSHNRIEVVPPEISKIVARIQEFSVKNNQLTHLPKEFFNLRYAATTRIDLSLNWFSDEELELIKTTMRTLFPQAQVIY
ncbi:unnamed protein product [Adineta ricciae]|uniref:Disease resistance R13L4/SHOC-2-like LRR domain-containing protein n=1 Tax=Adineta ricciae TaxID=249248 RepID=A0A815EM12_ADIRI|nr:unnamed protein product [Adineta ricciae]CAF1590872.1 unnamed protein product [Adineta ricciae]